MFFVKIDREKKKDKLYIIIWKLFRKEVSVDVLVAALDAGI